MAAKAKPRGRVRVAALLVGFVLVASAVIWRRSIGLRDARVVRQLEVERGRLEGEATKLESDIRQLSSRERLGAVAEQRLHMRVPADSQVIVLPYAPH
jgi:cell division protein FtsL